MLPAVLVPVVVTTTEAKLTALCNEATIFDCVEVLDEDAAAAVETDILSRARSISDKATRTPSVIIASQASGWVNVLGLGVLKVAIVGSETWRHAGQ